MYSRRLTLPNKSFLLLGPRGTGKSTWLREQRFNLAVDLLKSSERIALLNDPSQLLHKCSTLKKGDWVLIDEIQKVPALLDEVHYLYEEKKINFALSGSSARKLKRSQANLLAGRALNLNMFPLNYAEVENKVKIGDLVQWGTLPLVLDNFDCKEDTLESYIDNYLRQELIEEGIIRKLDSFARFLNISARMNAQILNVENIAREAKVPRPTVDKYFEILVDTLIGFKVPAYQPNFKAKENAHPKFFYFDFGVARAAAGFARTSLDKSDLGFALETFILNELRSYISYSKKGIKIFYYGISGGGDIDFVLQLRPKSGTSSDEVYLIEVKAAAEWKPSWNREIMSFVDRKKSTGIAGACAVYLGEKALKYGPLNVLGINDFLDRLHKGKLF